MNAIAKRTASPVPVIQLTSFNELVQFAQMAAKSKLVPPDYRGQPESVMLAVQLGSELGLSPMQSIQNIAVIGSRPTVWGDAMLALVLAHPDCEDVVEAVENDTAICTVKRRGRAPIVRRFSIPDAKQAQLWGKAGPWTTYPERMLQMRARGFALRDAFPDVLKGLISAEEARDIPARNGAHNGPTIDAVAEPARVNDYAETHGLDSDGIPSLDDLAPAAVSAPEPPVSDTEPQTAASPPKAPAGSLVAAKGTLRDAINTQVPLRPLRPTGGTWLDRFASMLEACGSRDEVEGVLLSNEVLHAGHTLRGAALARLRELRSSALARHEG
jgi:hypothetical protein